MTIIVLEYTSELTKLHLTDDDVNCLYTIRKTNINWTVFGNGVGSRYRFMIHVERVNYRFSVSNMSGY